MVLEDSMKSVLRSALTWMNEVEFAGSKSLCRDSQVDVPVLHAHIQMYTYIFKSAFCLWEDIWHPFFWVWLVLPGAEMSRCTHFPCKCPVCFHYCRELTFCKHIYSSPSRSRHNFHWTHTNLSLDSSQHPGSKRTSQCVNHISSETRNLLITVCT